VQTKEQIDKSIFLLSAHSDSNSNLSFCVFFNY